MSEEVKEGLEGLDLKTAVIGKKLNEAADPSYMIACACGAPFQRRESTIKGVMACGAIVSCDACWAKRTKKVLR
jgi:hypothetical protein